MKQPLAVRELALAALALLAAAVVLAVVAQTRHRSKPRFHPEGSYPALAGSGGVATGRRTDCGVVIASGTIGVAQPTLPCGTRLFLTYRGTSVLVQVIDHRLSAAGRQFDLTEALARELDLSGVRPIRWAYARAG